MSHTPDGRISISRFSRRPPPPPPRPTFLPTHPSPYYPHPPTRPCDHRKSIPPARPDLLQYHPPPSITPPSIPSPPTQKKEREKLFLRWPPFLFPPFPLPKGGRRRRRRSPSILSPLLLPRPICGWSSRLTDKPSVGPESGSSSSSSY